MSLTHRYLTQTDVEGILQPSSLKASQNSCFYSDLHTDSRLDFKLIGHVTPVLSLAAELQNSAVRPTIDTLCG